MRIPIHPDAPALVAANPALALKSAGAASAATQLAFIRRKMVAIGWT